MSGYVYKGGQPIALEQEHARLQAEIEHHRAILRKQQELAAVREQVAQNIGAESTAEKIRARAFITNGYTPEQCAARLNAATQDAARWRKQPRR